MDLKIENLTVDFLYPNKEIPAVSGVTTHIRAGRVTGIVGESGSGKSVLAMALLRLLPINARVCGTCLYGEKNLLTLQGKELAHLRRDQLALIPQNPYESLNPSFKVRRIFLNALAGKPLSRNEKLNQIKSLLMTLGFTDAEAILDRYSFELSGGMNQRVLAGLALIRQPEWIIADEPTKGLDAALQKDILQLFQRIAENVGSILVITHDLHFAYALCDDLIVLYNGEIVEEGPCREILRHPVHPYTQGLVASLPEMGMHPIPCAVNKAMRSGCCRFYERCFCAKSACTNTAPPLAQQKDGRKVRCFCCD